MRNVLLVGLGGALGSIARYLLAVVFAGWVGAGFPWATLFVNVVGSFLIGVITVLGLELAHLSDETRLFLATGLMGGFTTYSTFSLDTLRFFEAAEYLRGGAYVAATTLLCLLACAGGLFVGRTLGP